MGVNRWDLRVFLPDKQVNDLVTNDRGGKTAKRASGPNIDVYLQVFSNLTIWSLFCKKVILLQKGTPSDFVEFLCHTGL